MRKPNLLLLFALATVSACSCSDSEEVPTGFVPTGVDSGMGDDGCIDEDGDGYGENCGRRDCDDDDPEVTDLCFRCMGDAIIEGCDCEPGTPPEPGCDPPEIEDVVNGQRGAFVCTDGTRYCRGGVWGACEAIGEYVFVPYD